ncbi:MAG TPA: sigma 54-interacting transcriptional regulator [Marinobacter sp.]|nr:sigma 54-interacting transcriptional regulator [Marinobacter sp.]
MEQERPLVWLSATSGGRKTPALTLPGWHRTLIDLRQPPEAPAITRVCKPVGVCTLAGLDTGQLDNVTSWLERLPVPIWLAIVDRSQLDHSGVCELIRSYCQDYHTLPVDSQRLNHSLGHLWGMHHLRPACKVGEPADYNHHVLEGNSPAICRTRSLLRRLASTDEPVLVYGANGTGKEAAARFIHEHSSRRHGPLVFINCAALPESLTQSELFGHEKGAFTHALKARKGRIEAADGGTLVFSGADELGLTQQSAILRFLEEGTIEPVGASQPVRVDVRVIATCQTPLDRKVADGTFRGDVFYRLGNLAVTLPCLTERLEDLPGLAQRTLAAAGSRHHRLTASTLLAMAAHPWPGNLRELHNRLRQAVVLTRHPQIQPEDLGLPPVETPKVTEHFSLGAFRARADQEAIATSLALTHQNVSAAVGSVPGRWKFQDYP